MSIKNIQTLYKSILMELGETSCSTPSKQNKKECLSKITEQRITHEKHQM